MKAVRTAIRTDCATLRNDVRNLGTDISQAGADASRISRLRRTLYVSGIVQTYGLLEQSVDRILIATALAYNRIHDSYEQMPERIRADFRRLALQSLIDGNRARLREQVDETVILSALNAGTSPTLRQLVPAVFTRSQANYRHPQVREMFSHLDVTIDAPGSTTLQPILDELGMANVESVIADLAERRNTLAHAYSVPDEIFAMEQLVSVIEVVEHYLVSIEEAANSRLLTECEGAGLAVTVGTVKHRWAAAIGVDVKGCIIAPGDTLLFRRKRGKYLSRPVESLQVDDAHVDVVDATADTQRVGIGFRGSAPPRLIGATVLVATGLPEDLVPWRED